MYRITCDGLIILDTRLEGYEVFDPVVSVGTNTVGECTFKVYSSHPHFYDMNLLKSVFEVSDENGVIFRGRMTNNTRDFYNGKAVDLEGAMAFFNDSMVRPFVFPDEFDSATSSDNMVERFLDWLIYNHNSQVEKFQEFRLGNVTVTDPNNYLSRSSENIASTWQILKEKLFDSSLGGYLCIRYEEDGNYIDYLADFEETNPQDIRFGENLFDMKHELDASATYSAIIPIGADIEVESEGETITKKLTLESIPDGKLNNSDDTYKVTLYGGLHAIYSQTAVDNYGWVCCPIEESTWDDVTDVNNLKNKARNYLLGTAGFCSDNIEVTAADLHFTDAEIRSFRIYKKVNVISKPHNIEATYNLTRLSIDLVNPQNTKIVVGTIKDTLTDAVSRGGGGSSGSHGSGGGGGAIINASSIISALGYTPANENDIPDVPAWAKNPTKPRYTAEEVGARPNTWTPTASDVGADVSGTAETMVSEHNTNTEAHNDIRILVEELTTRLNALADSDDVTLDQMSELVAYIKDNRELIEGVTTDKVNVSDIIDNLTTNVSNKPLSAAQGVALKALIDAIPDAEEVVEEHNTDTKAHDDIRQALTTVTSKVNHFLNVSDEDYDQLFDLIVLITANQRAIELLRSDKLSGADIIDDLTTNVSNKVLSAAQGVALKKLIDAITVPTKLSDLKDDATHRLVTDEEKETWNNKSDFSGDYNDLTNIPETADQFDISESSILKWDGDTVGLKNIGNYDFRVYDEAPTLAEMQRGGSFSWVDDGVYKTRTFTAADLVTSIPGIIIVYGEDEFGEVIVATYDNAVLDGNFLEKGVYLASYDGKYICELKLNGYSFIQTTLKKKHLPEHSHVWDDVIDRPFGETRVTVGGDTIISDDVIYGKWVKVSDIVPTITDVRKSRLSYHQVRNNELSARTDVDYTNTEYYTISSDSGGIWVGDGGVPLIVISKYGDTTSINGMQFSGIVEPGIYFRQDNYYCTHSFGIEGYKRFSHQVRKIEGEWLPEDYIKQLAVESLSEDYIKQLIIESLPEDYIKQLIEEVINAGGGTGSEDGLQDLNGDYLYDVLQNKLITKE